MIQRLILTALCFCLCCGVALAQNNPAPEFVLQGNTWGFKHNNTIIPLPDEAVQSVMIAHDNLISVGINSEDDSMPWKKMKITAGIYVGPAAGPLRRISALPSEFPAGPMTQENLTPHNMAQASRSISLSPDKKILALGLIPLWEGLWLFYSWPDLQPINAINFYLLPMQEGKPELLWARPDVAVMNVLSGNPSTAYDTRQCQYDPCSIVSVQSFNVSSNTATMLFEGTPTCDYYIRSASAGVVTVDGVCLKKASSWKNFPENVTPKALQKKVP